METATWMNLLTYLLTLHIVLDLYVIYLNLSSSQNDDDPDMLPEDAWTEEDEANLRRSLTYENEDQNLVLNQCPTCGKLWQDITYHGMCVECEAAFENSLYRACRIDM